VRAENSIPARIPRLAAKTPKPWIALLTAIGTGRQEPCILACRPIRVGACEPPAVSAAQRPNSKFRHAHVEHAAMLVSMLIAKLLHHEEYTGHHHQQGERVAT
jgi:hypothetical protein